MLKFLVALVPSAGALFLFWVALRAIFQADRRERAAIARYEAAQASLGAPGGAGEGAGGGDPAAGVIGVESEPGNEAGNEAENGAAGDARGGGESRR